MIESYTRMLRNYMVLRGRTTRYDFWSFVLVQCVITIVALILSGVVHDAVGILLALYFFATIMPALGGIVRRLHDTGRGCLVAASGHRPWSDSLCLSRVERK